MKWRETTIHVCEEIPYSVNWEKKSKSVDFDIDYKATHKTSGVTLVFRFPSLESSLELFCFT